jgi:deoxyribodipyrimidine photo-lyase
VPRPHRSFAHCHRWPTSAFQPTNLGSLGITPGMNGGAAAGGRLLLAHRPLRRATRLSRIKGVSYLSVHLRFGTISIRELVAQALAFGAAQATMVPPRGSRNSIWREFYFMILDHFPHVVEAIIQARIRRDRRGSRALAEATVCRLVRRQNRLSAG